MRLSRFAHLINGNTLWHSLLFTKMTLSEQVAAAIAKATQTSDREIALSEEVASILQDRKFGFVAREEDDHNLLVQVVAGLPKPQVQSLFFIGTTDCNLACDYCLYGTPNSQSLTGDIRVMNPDMAREAISLFAATVSANNHPDGYWQAVTFYGGEPLLNLNMMRSAISDIRQLQATGKLWEGTELIVNTNGLLVDDGFITLAAKERMEIQVSLNGFQAIHNGHRFTHNKKGSFLEASSAIKRLIAGGVQVRPMVTLAEENIPDHPTFVRWMAEELGVTSYAANLLMSTTGNTKSGYAARAANAMRDAHEKNRDVNIADPSYTGQIQQFGGPEIARPSCGANGRKLTVFPDGTIHTCQALEASGIARVGQLPTVDFEGAWLNWQNRSRFSNTRCLKCPVIGSCGGGCLAGAYHANGDINQQDPNHCRWIKTLFYQWMRNA